VYDQFTWPAAVIGKGAQEVAGLNLRFLPGSELTLFTGALLRAAQ